MNRLALGLLLAAALAQSAHAAPTGVVGSLEFRGSNAVAPFSYVIPFYSVSFGNLQPNGAFTLGRVYFRSSVTTRTYLDFSDPAVRFFGTDGLTMAGGSFGPGQVGGSFGGIAAGRISRLSVRDKVGGLFWLDYLNPSTLVGRTRVGQFTTYPPGSDYGSVHVGAWRTGAAVISGTHPVVGPFVTQLTGTDQRGPGGVGRLSMVSPMRFVSLSGDSFPVFGILELEFVPEPSAAGLVLLGAVLVGLGARRR